MKRPNFFIVGAPKCGTTALSEYLRTHPNIYITDPKEPYYFCDDFECYRKLYSGVEQYEELFKGANDQHVAVGEASVWYLYSEVAAENIYQYNPNAKIIVMLRNPIEQVQSMHSQLLWTQDEDETDLIRAWRLQGERRNNRRIPVLCREASFLQYAKIASYSAQVERFISRFEREHIKIILFHEFIRNTRKEYLDVLNFLGVENIQKDDFPKVNANKSHRWKQVAKFTERPPEWIKRQIPKIKKIAGIKQLGLMDLIRRISAYEKPRKRIDSEFEQELKTFFAEDIKRLEEKLQIDLRYWR